MLDDLLEENIIELLELKHPEKANQIENLIYCKYHHLINHHVDKCFVLKDKIMRLHKNGDNIFMTNNSFKHHDYGEFWLISIATCDKFWLF
jgi:hypothetical protein